MTSQSNRLRVGHENVGHCVQNALHELPGLQLTVTSIPNAEAIWQTGESFVEV